MREEYVKLTAEKAALEAKLHDLKALKEQITVVKQELHQKKVEELQAAGSGGVRHGQPRLFVKDGSWVDRTHAGQLSAEPGSVPRAMTDKPQKLRIASRDFNSRLIMGTGKFASGEIMAAALEASGAELVTVALRRADLSGQQDKFANILTFIDAKKYVLLPNTSGARNAEEACRLARLGREATGSTWLKLEIHPDPRYLLPDAVETLKAAEILVKEGFTVLPYINADPVLAKRLEDAGCATVMPLGFTDRQRAGNRDAGEYRDHHRASDGAGRGRCRAGRAVACRRSHGNGRGCGAGEYCDCRRRRSRCGWRKHSRLPSKRAARRMRLAWP